MKNGKHISIVDGYKKNIFYYKNDLLHREKDLPAAIYHNGTKAWYQNGLKHRVGAPASIWNNGNIEWFFEGMRHCESGPALIYPGRKVEYYLFDIQYAQEDFEHTVMKWKLNQKLEETFENKPAIKRIKI